MAGSIIITGANGSLAIPVVDHLLKKYPAITAILAVRNDSPDDVNTKRLRETIARYPSAKASIHPLDLTDLKSVNNFTSRIKDDIANGKLPRLQSIICNAYHWNLVKGDPELTSDGFEKTIQVNHISHTSLVLQLLGEFAPDGGRVVLLSSNAHWPGKNMLEKYPPAIPDDHDLDQLAKGATAATAPAKDTVGRGMQRYANSKLIITAWMYALNRRLQKDPSLKKITAVAVNPGNLTDSRLTNTPAMLGYVKTILSPFIPLLRLNDPTMRKSALAAIDVAELAMNGIAPGEGGFFTMNRKDVSSPDSLDEGKQERIWKKSLEWAGVTRQTTGLSLVE